MSDIPDILIVDDDELDREAARRYLRQFGDLEVRFAVDGRSAIELMEQRRPDLVLSDVRMPGMDGLDLVEHARENFPLVPVVLMTSRGNEELAVRALQAGAASYVPKRALRQELADTVEKVLDMSAARRARLEILQYLVEAETTFELDNDPELLPPVVAYLQDSLERLCFHAESLRTHVGIALMEALSNAMIHGNLEVDSALRRSDRSEYQRQIEERRAEKPYADRRVRCTARSSFREVVYVISDEGMGFDWRSRPDPTTPENLLAVSGRGIQLMYTFMDSVEFNESGTQVTMTKRNPEHQER